MTARHATRRPNYTARRILALILGATTAGVLGAISGAAVAAVTAL